MKRVFCLLFFSILIYSCSSDEEAIKEEKDISRKLIESLSFDNETSVDSLYYNESNKLILKEEYIDIEQLDYATHYQYDSDDNLIKTYRIHSTSNIPIVEVNYTYYSNGTLKSRNYIGYDLNYTDHFEYESNVIILNRNQGNEIRINLDSDNKILSAERKDINNEFYTFKEYIYKGENITEININENSQNISYSFEYDNKNNPFVVFDHNLPNNLSIKKIEAVILNSNYPFITIGDDDNYFGFLNKNNVVSCSGNSSNNYSYIYDSDNYPEQINYNFLSNPDSLIITYY
ncbi:hypothetical protein [uncultured Marixanthomonas sp.]|uniref:hypothetical protein n=1 Tax=uncultured Marixanthomonas sp. TaxID=757245 RepID=UPI0030D97980|tara:strand:- start:55241 stop:56107 length:867 start_codon:yes stop_codon:yes gene_type:complete